MKTAINLSDNKRRYSRVAMESGSVRNSLKAVDSNLQPLTRYRAVKNTMETGFKQLIKDRTAEELSEKIIEADPEIDLELFGKKNRSNVTNLSKFEYRPSCVWSAN